MFELGLIYRCPRLCSLSYCGSWGNIIGVSSWVDVKCCLESGKMMRLLGFTRLSMIMTMNDTDDLHYCCSIWLLWILIATMVSIPSHLLVVPHAKRLLKIVMEMWIYFCYQYWENWNLAHGRDAVERHDVAKRPNVRVARKRQRTLKRQTVGFKVLFLIRESS